MRRVDQQAILVTGSTDGLGRALARDLAVQGASVLLHGRPALEGVTGKYFDRMREGHAHAQAYDPDARRRLRELSAELVGRPTEGRGREATG